MFTTVLQLAGNGRRKHIMTKNYRLVHVPFEEAEDGELYLTKSKHGWIEGYWDDTDKVCRKYYWRDMEWWPSSLYKMEEEGDEKERLREALKIAEAALADIGDADREEGYDLAWCEIRAANALPKVRAALKEVEQ
jgi:hypothetical protein